jgi:DNA processing protein
MNNSHVLLHLLLTDHLPIGTIDKLVARKPAHVEWCDLYSFSATQWEKVFKLREQAASVVVEGLKNKKKLEQQLALIDRHSISWTTVLGDDYPTSLKNIHVPPVIIFWQGADLDDTEKKIGIVGSRLANSYGQQVIDMIVPPLVGNEWTVVSGGALGADTMAHKATLAAGGKTIVVLGCGLLESYPAQQGRLAEKIIESGGTLISQFPVDMESSALTFPARNRIISGLSKGCVVVQAAEKSGALITARFALEQGKEVFAVPGMVTEKLSFGCHALIQQGAKLVTSVSDILVEFGEELPENEEAEQEVGTKKTTKTKNKQLVEEVMEDQMGIDQEPVDPERKIIIACRRPCTVDDLLEVTSLELQTLQSLLFDLQLSGKLMQTMTGMWQICQK